MVSVGVVVKPSMLGLFVLFVPLFLRSAAASLVVFGDSYSDAGTAGYGVHQVVHEAFTTPQIDTGEPWICRRTLASLGSKGFKTSGRTV